MWCVCLLSCVIGCKPWRTERRSRAGCEWFLPASAAWWDELLWTASGNLGWWNYSTVQPQHKPREREKERGIEKGCVERIRIESKEEKRWRGGKKRIGRIRGWNKGKEELVLVQSVQTIFLIQPNHNKWGKTVKSKRREIQTNKGIRSQTSQSKPNSNQQGSNKRFHIH